MGNTTSIAGRDCLLSAVGGNPALAAFQNQPLYQISAVDSAATAVHDMPEQNGLRWNQTNPEYWLGRYQHREFLDIPQIYYRYTYSALIRISVRPTYGASIQPPYYS